MKALVIIPTTTRPVVITSLRERPGLPASLVVADGDFRSLPISADYDKLIGAAGPLGLLTGHPGLPSHELRLSQGFETGRSWEVPVCLAHYVTSRGATLVKTPAEADLVVWATGAVDIDLGIVKDRYYLAKKLEVSLPLLDGLRPDARFAMFLPAGTLDGMGDAAMRRQLAQSGVDIVEVGNVRDAVLRIEPMLAERLGGGPPAPPVGVTPSKPEPARSRPPRSQAVAMTDGAEEPEASGSRALLMLGSLLILAAFAAAGWLWASGKLPWQRPAGGGSQLAAGAQQPATQPGTGERKPAGAASGASRTDKGGDPKAGATQPKTGGAVVAASDAKGAPKPQGGQDGGSAGPAQPRIINPNAGAAAGGGDAKGDGAVAGGPGSPADDAPPDLLIIEEQRAPAGLTCRQLAFGSQRPEIALLKPTAGRFPASDVEGLCALVYRRGPGGAAFGIEIEAPLMQATIDAARFGSGASLKAGDVARLLREDFRRPLSYSVTLRPAAGADGVPPVRYVHELRR